MSTHTQAVPLTGTLQGSTLSVTVGGAAATFGTLAGGHFTLNFPQSNGALAPVSFASSSAAHFNQVLAKLDQELQSENAAAANARALQDEEQTIAADAQAVQSDICQSCGNTVQSVISSAVSVIQTDLASETKDLATTHSDEQNELARAKAYPGGDSGNVCYDASIVEYHASNVAYDANNISNDLGNVTSDISSARSAVGSLSNAFSKYLSAQAQLPSFLPPNAPTKQEIATVEQSVAAAISSAVNTTNSYIDQANSEVATAFDYAVAAYKAGGCGPGPTPPPPLNQIG